ncbi:MAG: DUF3617 domain-containing protein [Sandaracinobacteroides sp.]
MLRFAANLLLMLAGAQAMAQPALPIPALQDYEPGMWQIRAIGATGSQSLCVADPNLLLTGGRAASDCSFSLISSQPNGAVVTYKCSAGRSGRTELRREAGGLYTVNAQGVEGGLPFAARSEWRRTGAC